MKIVLFICVHNAGRSQMAEAFFNRMAKGKAVAISAGTEPASSVNPIVAQAMRETGIEIGGKKPKLLTEAIAENADLAITMGCMDKACPAGLIAFEDWGLPNPKGKPIEEIRPIRDEIKRRVEELIKRIS